MRLNRMFLLVPLLGAVLLGACKKDEDLGERPNVSATDPINEAVGVSVNHKVSATFNMEMDEASIDNTSFSLKKSGANVPGTVEYVGTTALFTPTSNLDASTLYTAVISTQVKSLLGRNLVEDYTWTFTTGLIPDDTAPTVTVTDPLNNATDIAIDRSVAITFSEPMDPSTMVASTFALKQGGTSVPIEVSYSGTTATLTPVSPLMGERVYAVTVTTNAKDMAGNALATFFAMTFTTGIAPDIELPRVNAVLPLGNAVDVNVDTVVVITFSEAMLASTITTESFTLMQGTTEVEGAVSYADQKATFTPSVDLAYGAIYTAAIHVTATDLAGNALASKTEWSFTTENEPDTEAPTVLTLSPAENEVDVAISALVAVEFSEEMNEATINATSFTLFQGTTQLDGAVTYTGNTATFTPNLDLEEGLTYTATITTEATDLAGNALAANSVWTFTTAAPVFTLDPVILNEAGNYVILAQTAINNNPTSAITGDLGLSPAAASFITGFSLTANTGFATSSQVSGQLFAADMAAPTPNDLTVAVGAMVAAYNDAASRPTPDFSELNSGEIGGLTLTPGLYKWTSTVTASTDVTISGGANDVFIFQISGDLSQSNAVNITLVGGAQAKNIFWQVAGQVTIGSTAHFEGVILSMTGVTMQSGASMNGRALAQTAVILDANTLTEPSN